MPLGTRKVFISPSFSQMKRVVQKQHHARFYSIASYVFSLTIVNLPIAVLDCLLFGSIVYW